MTIRPTPPPAKRSRDPDNYTLADLERDRQEAYRSKGYRKEGYIYPKGSRLTVVHMGRLVRLPSSDISNQSYYAVRNRILNLQEEYRKCTISIDIPSKYQ